MSFLYSVSTKSKPGGLKEFGYGRLVRTTDKMAEGEDSLKAWMTYIFPEEDVRINTTVPSDIQLRRGANTARNLRVTCRIERLSLVVELDTLKLYQSPYLIQKSRDQEAYLVSLGYRVIRIPYWVQLSTDAIFHYFGVSDLLGCDYPSGFYVSRDPCFERTPANYSTAGLKLMVSQLRTLPYSVRRQVLRSMDDACDSVDPRLIWPEDYFAEHHLRKGLSRV